MGRPRQQRKFVFLGRRSAFDDADADAGTVDALGSRPSDIRVGHEVEPARAACLDEPVALAALQPGCLGLALAHDHAEAIAVLVVAPDANLVGSFFSSTPEYGDEPSRALVPAGLKFNTNRMVATSFS